MPARGIGRPSTLPTAPFALGWRQCCSTVCCCGLQRRQQRGAKISCHDQPRSGRDGTAIFPITCGCLRLPPDAVDRLHQRQADFGHGSRARRVRRRIPCSVDDPAGRIPAHLSAQRAHWCGGLGPDGAQDTAGPGEPGKQASLPCSRVAPAPRRISCRKSPPTACEQVARLQRQCRRRQPRQPPNHAAQRRVLTSFDSCLRPSSSLIR